QENLEHFLKMSKLTLPIWFQYNQKGVELSISEISERAKNIYFSDRIREIYNALDDFNTQEQLITEIENCVHLLIK
ncbi:TPA: hypothetical protein U1132_000693, partial [Streptococcus suis]|nr:hypothetical protein [Streptococcus suis]